MERKMDVIVNLPDPSNIQLPSVPFVVANGMQEALIVGSRVENNVPIYCLTNLQTGETVLMGDAEFKVSFANKLYSIADCSINVNI